jgi:hypothetical protein
MLKVVFVIKYVVMVKDIHLNVMMAITLMVMVAVKIVELKLDFHVLEVHQIQKTHVVQYYQLKSQYKIEDNQDYMEKLL